MSVVKDPYTKPKQGDGLLKLKKKKIEIESGISKHKKPKYPGYNKKNHPSTKNQENSNLNERDDQLISILK